MPGPNSTCVMRKRFFVAVALLTAVAQAQLPPMRRAKQMQQDARELQEQSRQQQAPQPPPPTKQPAQKSSNGSYPTASPSSSGAVSVHKAASTGNLDELKYLESKGASLVQADAEQSTPLHLAAYRGNKEVVEYLLNRPGMLKDPVDKRGYTPVMLAAAAGHAEVLQSLIDGGCSVTLAAADGSTALHKAAAQGNLACVEELLKAGADPKATDMTGKTPADLAAKKKKGDWELVVSQLKKASQQ